MPHPVDADDALRALKAIGSAPTAPYHEWRAVEAIRSELERRGIASRTDTFGQLFARIRRGEPKRALALVAHTDHPAFEVVEARGSEGRARVSGGFRTRSFARPAAIVIHHDDGRAPLRATLDDYVQDVDEENNSPGHARIRADGRLERGQWAVLDLPGLEVQGDELRMRAADDLAGAAIAVLALATLRDGTAPIDVHAVFTRAEETGLFGARLIAEDGGLDPDAYVVSIEASRALPHTPPGAGIVVRAGDLHNTFSNDAERYLRVGRERLALAGIRTQRALLTGGTCEASAFVRLGWTATGIALPNVNYHNSPEGQDGFAPEIVRLSDVLSGIALLAEAAIAAGEDASESWWPSARRVPERIRALLARPRAGPPDRHGPDGP